MDCCKNENNIKVINKYDPRPRNKNGSVRWYLYRWDDGKNGSRKTVQCCCCGNLYLVQSYHLNQFSAQKDTLYEDWYQVESEKQADYLNRTYTGIQLEHLLKPSFQKQIQSDSVVQ